MTEIASRGVAGFAADGVAEDDILTLLRRRAEVDPDAIAIEDVDGLSLTYVGLLGRVEWLASQILSRCGGKVRPRIAIVMPNGGAFSESILAASVIGTALPFNPSYTDREFEDYFHSSGLDLVLTCSDFSPASRNVARQMGLTVVDVDSLSPTTSGSTLPTPAPDDLALVLFTSGSTGRPKRVPLTHRNVCSAARAVVDSLGLTGGDRCLSMWELFHVGGLVDLLLAPLISGGTVIATPGFDAARFFELVEQRKPTWFQAVPTALSEISVHTLRDGLARKDLSLRFLRSVAARLSPALQTEVESLFGVPVITTFGMTEAGPLITSTGFDLTDRPSGSVGRSCGCEIGIFDEHWQQLPAEAEGEVAIRGSNVFSGYENDPEANAAAFREGWFRTGDLGRIDSEGRLFLTGRIKELVNRGGEKVNLREVDDALLLHPAILEAAAFAVPHRTLGEDVACAVVLRAKVDITEAELRSALASRLAPFKIPRRIDFLPALPRNAVGKIDRKKLASNAAEAETSPAGGLLGRHLKGELEDKIAQIWARELRLASVGPLDDFVRLGGDSLAALRVMMAVEAETGLVLPDETLSCISNVRNMAAALANVDHKRGVGFPAESESISPEQLRQIKAVIAMGSVPTLRDGSLFKVINLSGRRKPLIWFFNRPNEEIAALQENLPPDQPLFGGFSGGRVFNKSDDMMDRLGRVYADALLAEFPQGSFVLGGNCKGGRLAWEVALHLRKAGRDVERLCLVEYAHPELTNFDKPLLLLFGKQSRRRAYRDIRWGNKGWDRAFLQPPDVAWIDGAHGEFFQGEPNKGFVGLLMAFLDGRKIVESTLATPHARQIMRIHSNPLTFALYRALCRLLSFPRNALGRIR